MTPTTTQDHDAALVEQIAVKILSWLELPPHRTVPEEMDATDQIVTDIIQTVREHDMDAAAPWPLPQEMP